MDALLLSARVEADLSDFERELARGQRVARAFGGNVSREVAAGFSTPRLDVSGLGGQGTAGGRAFVRGLEREVAGVRPFDGIATQARVAAGAIGAAFSIRAAVSASDAWTSAANRLALVTGSAEEAAAAQQRLFDLAQETRVAFTGTVDVFSRFARAARDIGASQAEVLSVTRAINQSLAVSGTSAESAQAALVQLGQGLGAGALRGEELNSVLEQAPRLAQALADALTNGSLAALRAMGAEGQLTSERVFGALLGQAAQINAEFSSMSTTIGQAFQQVENAALRFVGATGEASGAGRALSGTLSAIADNFDTLAATAIAATSVLAARTFGGRADSMLRQIREEIVLRRQQGQAIVQLSFAEQAQAAAAAEAAAADVRRTQTRVANLQRVEQAQMAGIARERAMLASAAAEMERLRGVSPRALAPLGGAVVERELRARAAAQAAVERSSRNLLLIEQQQAATAARLAGANAALATQTAALGAAQTTAAARTAAHTAALNGLTLSARAAALAGRALSGALALLGGPIGASIVAIGAAFAYVATRTTAAEEAASKYADELARVRSAADSATNAITRLNRDQAAATRLRLNVDLGEAQEALAAIKDELRGGANLVNDFFGGRAATDYNRELGALQRAFVGNRLSAEQFAGSVSRLAERFPQFREQALEVVAIAQSYQAAEIRAQSLTSTLKQLDTAQAAVQSGPVAPARLDVLNIDQEVADLAKLRESGAATQADLARIAEITARAREQLREFAAVPVDDRSRAARVELQGVIETLTGETRRERTIRVGITAETDEAEQQLRKFITGAEATVVRLDVARELGAGASELTTLLDDVVAAQKAVSEEIARQGGLHTANIDLLQAQARLAVSLGEAYDRANRARVVGAPPGGYSQAPPPFLLRGDQIATDAERAAGAMGLAVRQGERFADTLSQIGTAGRGILNATRLVGGLNDAFRGALEGALGVIDGLEQMQRAKAAADAARLSNPFDLSSATSALSQITSLVGIIGGAVGIVGSLFNRGPSPVEVALDKNRASLDRLTAGVDRAGTLGGSSEVSRVLTALVARQSEFDFGLLRTFAGEDNLDAAARGLGISLAELEAAAAELGIDLRDSKNRLLIPALEQFGLALEAARANALRLGTTFNDLTRVNDVRADLFNVEGPAAAWADAIRLAEELLPAQVAAALRSFNISTTEGQALARDYLQQLFTDASQGRAVDLLLESGFASLDEFFQFLLLVEDPLDQLGQSAREASEALAELNVPAGFKREFLEYLATAPIGPTVTLPTPTPLTYTPPPSTPTPASAPTVTYRDESRAEITVVLQAGEGITRETVERVVVPVLDDYYRDRARAIDGRLQTSIA